LNEQFESGNESNHVALSYRFDSIYSYTLFVDVICTYTRDNNEKPKLRTGKPQGDEKQTLPPQKKPILYSIKCIPYLFFFFFPSVEDIFFTSQCTSLSSTHFLLEVGRWTSSDQQQVLAGQMELIAAVSEVAAAAAAAAVEVEIFEVAAQTPAAEVL